MDLEMVAEWLDQLPLQDILLTLGCGAAGAISLCTLFPYFSKVRGLPHPTRYPLIGNLARMGVDPHLSLNKLAEELGGRFKLVLGSKEVVVLSSFDAIKESLGQSSSWNLHSRPLYYSFSLPPGGRNLSFEPYNDKYRFLKKTALDCLKIPFKKCPVSDGANDSLEYGATTMQVEDMVNRELELLFNNLPENKEIESAEKMTRWLIMRCACLLFTGMQLEGDLEQEAHSFLKNVDGFVDVIPLAALADNNPLLHYLLLPKIWGLEKLFKRISDFVMKLYVNFSDDSMFAHLQSSTSRASGCPVLTTEFEVLSIGTHLLGAMVPITSRTLQWVFLFLLNRPALLQQVRAELVESEFNLKSKDTNVFLNAVINETLRFVTPTPISIPRATAEDVSDGDVFIPKGTPVLVNLYGANHDSKRWKFPDEFNINNFLNEDESSLDRTAVESMMSFSTGRRRCVGEKLAYSLLFLTAGTILQKFNIGHRVGHGNEKISEAQHTRLDVVSCDFGLKLTEDNDSVYPN